MNRAWLSASSPGSRAVTSSRGNLDSSATPLKVFCPCTATLYPSASKGSRGKASSTHLVSCKQTMSGCRSASQAVRLSIRCLIELTFHVAICMGVASDVSEESLPEAEELSKCCYPREVTPFLRTRRPRGGCVALRDMLGRRKAFVSPV